METMRAALQKAGVVPKNPLTPEEAEPPPSTKDWIVEDMRQRLHQAVSMTVKEFLSLAGLALIAKPTDAVGFILDEAKRLFPEDKKLHALCQRARNTLRGKSPAEFTKLVQGNFLLELPPV